VDILIGTPDGPGSPLVYVKKVVVLIALVARTRRFRPAVVVFAFLLPALAGLILLAGLGGQAVAAENPGVIASKTAEKFSVQTELPGKVEEPKVPIRPISFSGGIYVLYAMLAIAVLVILWTMRDSIGRLFRRPVALNGEDAVVIPEISVERLEGAQLEADELAAQGRFVEAMHMLLLRAFTELRRSFALRFADSLTSRELLKLLPLPAGTLAALADLVTRVELAYFGQYSVIAGDYLACRKSFDVLTATARGQERGRAQERGLANG